MNWYKTSKKQKIYNHSKWINIDSSFITHVAFFKSLKILEIKFSNGRIYLYENVPFKIYLKLVNSESKGDIFNNLIKNRYVVRKIA